ncbi:hypothetical protein, partial [Collinsella aerofaciens]|uniref:hypothetical protein n=1 Tax=Collinsella aerofaciens TaxID=74426 RepID=UPI0034A56721
VAEPDGVPQEAWIRLGAVQEIVRTPFSLSPDSYLKYVGYRFQNRWFCGLTFLFVGVGKMVEITPLAHCWHRLP